MYLYMIHSKGKGKVIRYRPGVAQRVCRDIALLFHDRGTRRGWVVSSTPRPHFTPGKDPVPILQEAGWAPGPVWTRGKSRPHRDSMPDRPARSQSLYRLSYPAHMINFLVNVIRWWMWKQACVGALTYFAVADQNFGTDRFCPYSRFPYVRGTAVNAGEQTAAST